jgi:titin
VTATNSAGTSATSNLVTLTPTTVPGAPVLTGVAGKGTASLSWTAPATGGTPITGYTILRGVVPGQEQPIQTITQGTSYVDGTVVKGTTYSYVVRAVNDRGAGARSNAVSITAKK